MDKAVKNGIVKITSQDILSMVHGVAEDQNVDYICEEASERYNQLVEELNRIIPPQKAFEIEELMFSIMESAARKGVEMGFKTALTFINAVHTL